MFWKCREFRTLDISSRRILTLGHNKHNPEFSPNHRCFQLLRITANDFRVLENLKKVNKTHIYCCIVGLNLGAKPKHENSSKYVSEEYSGPNYTFSCIIIPSITSQQCSFDCKLQKNVHVSCDNIHQHLHITCS
jgi:hypothetical protein